MPSGLFLTLFRAYDPDTGRWTSRDSLGESAGINLYNYCFNDPINSVDPDGRFILAAILVGLAVGGALYALIQGGSMLENGAETSKANAAMDEMARKHTDYLSAEHYLTRNSDCPTSGSATGGREKNAGGALLAGGAATVYLAGMGLRTPTATRALTEADLGIQGTVKQLKGTFSVKDGVARVHVDALVAQIKNPLGVINNLANAAKAEGATTLRIESMIANPDLRNALGARYEMYHYGGKDVIIIPLE